MSKHKLTDSPNIERFLEAVHSTKTVNGLTHNFYRYPARFSPLFPREAIKCFTQPGDLVIDPFMGGGTTIVEAQSLGRKSLGSDINSLAVFISKVKTTVYSKSEITALKNWARNLNDKLKLNNPSKRPTEWIDLGYQKNINNKISWPIRKSIELALQQIDFLSSPKFQLFARCVLLKTAQWALDCRIKIPSAEHFRNTFTENFHIMIQGAIDYAKAVKESKNAVQAKASLKPMFFNCPFNEISSSRLASIKKPPALILTSPPYPGVHALYHRWQIFGRKETPAPYWIANCMDGNGASFYTLGDRKQKEQIQYFEQIKTIFSSLAKVSDKNTLVIQMVGFSEPSWQLPKYLQSMREAGFKELNIPGNGRIWRSVPNRKWYADLKGKISSSREVVLLHRLK
ncbi:MAG: site-specific DNA-methyltransferase [Nitrospinae bacterium]|nr:site-specific DNA-methyltransferase [Nitrospinota bacterium]